MQDGDATDSVGKILRATAPGDVAAMRFAVTRDDIGRRAINRLDRMDAGRKLGMSEQTAVALDSIAAHWLYRAVPYYVELHTLVGLVDCITSSPAHRWIEV